MDNRKDLQVPVADRVWANIYRAAAAILILSSFSSAIAGTSSPVGSIAFFAFGIIWALDYHKLFSTASHAISAWFLLFSASAFRVICLALGNHGAMGLICWLAMAIVGILFLVYCYEETTSPLLTALSSAAFVVTWFVCFLNSSNGTGFNYDPGTRSASGNWIALLTIIVLAVTAQVRYSIAVGEDVEKERERKREEAAAENQRLEAQQRDEQLAMLRREIADSEVYALNIAPFLHVVEQSGTHSTFSAYYREYANYARS